MTYLLEIDEWDHTRRIGFRNHSLSYSLEVFSCFDKLRCLFSRSRLNLVVIAPTAGAKALSKLSRVRCRSGHPERGLPLRAATSLSKSLFCAKVFETARSIVVFDGLKLIREDQPGRLDRRWCGSKVTFYVLEGLKEVKASQPRVFC